MRKPKALRDYLADGIPELGRDRDRFLVFVDRGNVVSTFAPGRSFEYSYTLNLIVTDFAGDPDAIMLLLLDWVRVNQSELLANEKLRQQITFEVDVLANDKVDLDIKLPLTEAIIVTRGQDGTVTMVPAEEPQIDQPFPARHWKLFLKDELLAEWDAPGG